MVGPLTIQLCIHSPTLYWAPTLWQALFDSVSAIITSGFGGRKSWTSLKSGKPKQSANSTAIMKKPFQPGSDQICLHVFPTQPSMYSKLFSELSCMIPSLILYYSYKVPRSPYELKDN